MKRIANLPLLVIGASLILAPLAFHTITSAIDKDRVAEFYRQNPNAETLPQGLKPSDNAGYEWACFAIGVSIAFSGIREREAKQAESGKPAAWEHAEI